jgi:hypothetical protein
LMLWLCVQKFEYSHQLKVSFSWPPACPLRPGLARAAMQGRGMNGGGNSSSRRGSATGYSAVNMEAGGGGALPFASPKPSGGDSRTRYLTVAALVCLVMLLFGGCTPVTTQARRRRSNRCACIRLI